MISINTRTPTWIELTLFLAALYNALWGLSVVLAPNLFFEYLGLELPRYPQLWQCIGMIVGVYAPAYALAALNPYRHWPIVLVGLLGKILGPAGFAFAYFNGELPGSFLWIIVFNDLIWWIPFLGVLLHVFLAFPYFLRQDRSP